MKESHLFGGVTLVGGGEGMGLSGSSSASTSNSGDVDLDRAICVDLGGDRLRLLEERDKDDGRGPKRVGVSSPPESPGTELEEEASISRLIANLMPSKETKRIYSIKEIKFIISI